jgi:hypothetical protein
MASFVANTPFVGSQQTQHIRPHHCLTTHQSQPHILPISFSAHSVYSYWQPWSSDRQIEQMNGWIQNHQHIRSWSNCQASPPPPSRTKPYIWGAHFGKLQSHIIGYMFYCIDYPWTKYNYNVGTIVYQNKIYLSIYHQLLFDVYIPKMCFRLLLLQKGHQCCSMSCFVVSWVNL